MEFLFCVFSSNPCILCANPYLNDIELKLPFYAFISEAA